MAELKERGYLEKSGGFNKQTLFICANSIHIFQSTSETIFTPWCFFNHPWLLTQDLGFSFGLVTSLLLASPWQLHDHISRKKAISLKEKPLHIPWPDPVVFL